MAKTCLIIGGSGLIGRALTRRLLSSGWDVTVVSRGLREAPADLVEAASSRAMGTT